MDLLMPIVLIVLGALAAANFIIAKQPNAKAALDKIAPFQGIIGVIAAVWSLWNLIQFFVHISGFSFAPVFFLLILLIVLLTLALGFLMGYGLIAKYALSKNAEAAAKGEVIRAKLVTFQTPLGLAGIVVGIIGLIRILMLTH